MLPMLPLFLERVEVCHGVIFLGGGYMRLSEAIDALLLATQANGRSQRTVNVYGENLRYLLDALGDPPMETITVHDLRRYVSAQLARVDAGELSPFTVAGRVRMLKRLFSFLADEEVLSVNPAARIKTPQPRRIIPKGISHEDLRLLLESAEGDSLADLRDRAIILFLADTGCRVGGLCGLQLGDVDIEARCAWVTEKGEKTREVYLLPMTAGLCGPGWRLGQQLSMTPFFWG